MKYYPVRFIIFFLVSQYYLNSFTQEPDTANPVNLEEIVVSATKTTVNRHNVPLAVTVLSEKTVQNSSESALLPVLSEHVPGLFVTERGITGFGVATGSAGQISMRGIGGSPNTQVLVLLNGNPQFMGIMGHPLADAYVASDVEKVEVIRGPASTLYGTNAMGGVINIITREQIQEGFNANARVMLGSYGTRKYMINGGTKQGRFNVFASFNHDHTRGHRDSAEFSMNNGYVRMGYELNKNITVNADFSLAKFEAADPGPVDENAGYTINITRGMGALSLDNQFRRTNGSARFFYNFGEHLITDGFHSEDLNYGTVIYQSFKLFPGNVVSIGTDLKNYGGLAENEKAMNGNGMVFGDTTVWEAALYAYIQQQLFEKLTLNAGFRLEHNSIYGNEPVPAAGLAYRPGANTTIKASVAKGFRSPTIRELYLFTPANESLQPEHMLNMEIGIIQRFMKNRLSLEWTIFNASGDNLIQTLMSSEGPLNQNSGEFSNTGLEFAGSYNPVDFVGFRAAYSYISMDEPVIATPEHHLNFSANYRWNKMGLHLSLQHVHNLYTRINPVQSKETYTLLHSRLSYEISKYADVFIKGENLTNKLYTINYGYPMPRFVIFAGINLHLNLLK